MSESNVLKMDFDPGLPGTGWSTDNRGRELKGTRSPGQWYAFLRSTRGPSHAEAPEWRDRMKQTVREDSAPLFMASTAEEVHAWIRSNRHLNTYKP